MARRCGSRFSAWPYNMYKLSRERSTHAEKQLLAREVLDAPDYMLNSYTKGVRKLFNSTDALTS
eukprot:4947554-Pyramimonas_sp.AAC.1